MSLARHDDPRNWVLPGASRPPFHARLLYYDLTKSERALLLAFDELCSSSFRLWASLETYALHSGLCERHVYNLIHGRDRNGRHTPGFIERGILTLESETRRPRRGSPHQAPAIYVFHEAAIPLHPKALTRQDARRQQSTLPGIRRPAVPGEPFDSRNQVPRQPEPGSNDSRNQVPRQPEPVAEDSKALFKGSLDSKAGILARARERMMLAKGPPRPFHGERFPLTFSQTDLEAFRQLKTMDDEGGHSQELFQWLCRKTGATGRCPVLFEIEHPPVDWDELVKMELAIDAYWSDGPGSEYLGRELDLELLDPNEPRGVLQWASDRIGVTRERGRFLEMFQLQTLPFFSVFEFQAPPAGRGLLSFAGIDADLQRMMENHAFYDPPAQRGVSA